MASGGSLASSKYVSCGSSVIGFQLPFPHAPEFISIDFASTKTRLVPLLDMTR